MVSPRDESCRVAFKEWEGVCDALIEGRQALLIRKGGINEAGGPGEFEPEYREFWLYPTSVHQAEQGLRTGGEQTVSAQAAARAGPVLIRGLVRVDLIARVSTEKTLAMLEEFHIFTAETIMKRFHYRRPGLWVLSVRVWRREPAFAVNPTPLQTGCRTWVELDEPLSTAGLTPALDDDEWARRRDRLRSVLDSET